MFRLMRIIFEYKEPITLCFLIIISFSLMSLGDTTQLRGFRALSVTGIGTVQEVFSFIPNPAALKAENEALRELNYYLSKEVGKERKAKLENERLRSLLDIKQEYEFPVVVAEVVQRVTSGLRRYVYLNAGSEDGIQEGMTVANDRGLVGHVFAVEESHCLVQLITNLDTRISVVDERSRVEGILVWEGGRHMKLTKVAKSRDVQAGDMLLTSGFSSMYPEDVYVGTVAEVTEEPGSLFREILVEPRVDFDILEQVFVSMQVPHPEILELRKKLQEKINLER